MKKCILCDFGYGLDGKYEDGFWEFEFIFLYKDLMIGKKLLFVGVVIGVVGKRFVKVYVYYLKENVVKFGIDLV